MVNPTEQVANEGISLLRLCSDLKEFIKTGRQKKTYLIETDKFLNYLLSSIKPIESFVKAKIQSELSAELVKSNLRDFNNIKKALSWFYILTRQAIDADSLSIPFSLATFINSITKKIEKSNAISLVMVGGTSMMFYKCNLNDLRDLANTLSIRIKRYPAFPPDIGILMFPYCSAHELLVNCDLFHETGHFVYERTELSKKFYTELCEKFVCFVKDNNLIEAFTDPLISLNDLRNYVLRLILRWVDEIFADVFAIRIAGPAFHFAYLELQQVISLSAINSEDEAGINDERAIFSETHPADNYRFKLHEKWLSKGGWDKIIEKNTPIIFDNLKRHKALQIGQFKIRYKPPVELASNIEKKLQTWMLKEFDGTIEDIENEVEAKLNNIEEPFVDFERNFMPVLKSLENGIVPSTVYHNEKEKCHPSPFTILNAGFLFYLDGMRGLLDRVVDTDEIKGIVKRIHYERRLNEWLGKAIDDWQILQKEGLV